MPLGCEQGGEHRCRQHLCTGSMKPGGGPCGSTRVLQVSVNQKPPKVSEQNSQLHAMLKQKQNFLGLYKSF